LAVEHAFAGSAHATPDAVLAKAVARLSDLYTTDRARLSREQADAAHLAAKREYFLASDAPKVALALDECTLRSQAFARLSSLACVRVADLGAGVGATSVGFLAWLAGARAARGTETQMCVAFHAVELGAPAARVYEDAVRTAAAAIGVDVTITIEARDFRSATLGEFDLILCQTALNEFLGEGVTSERHAATTVALVTDWALRAPLLVIEPALRTTTRALMALRDDVLAPREMLAASELHPPRGFHIVAPCPHQGRCPMLARAGDWCHEARRVDPTPRVAAIDRIVGRRDERALFAFLATAPGAAPVKNSAPYVRVVTDTLGSRGKTERLVCRSDGELRLMRLLDRETSDSNRAFLDSERGAMLAIEPMPANDRISPAAVVGAV
jgi:ribosomal protein RSM22 (predicted rRNA methylase)